MTRIERRVFRNSVLVGMLLTLGVLLAQVLGWLQTPENWMYDLRARYFQFHANPPTDALVHVDIDDKAIDGIGYWPWPRSKMAEMVDEMRLAGAKVIGLDILYAEPQPVSYETTTNDDGTTQLIREIDHDALLAAAIKRAGNVLVPGSIYFQRTGGDPIRAAVVQQLTTDLELTEQEVADRLRAENIRPADLNEKLVEIYLPARREAAYRRLRLEMASRPLTLPQLRQKLLVRSAAGVSSDAVINSPVSRVLEEQFIRYQAAKSLARFGADIPPDAAALAPAAVHLAPINRLSDVAAASAFIDFRPGRDGVVRTVPLLADCDGKIFPQFGLSLALLYLGVKPQDLRYTADLVTIPCPDGRSITVPVREAYSEIVGRTIPMTFHIPWFGGHKWETMYDFPAHEKSERHLSMGAVWEPCLTRRKMIRNNATADAALRDLSRVLNNTAPATKPAAQDVDAWEAAIDRALADAKETLEFTKGLPPADLDADSRLMLKAAEALQIIRRENTLLKEQLVTQRKTLEEALKDKAVVIGATATALQDATPTSLHALCPGVVTHGAVFNAMVTGRFWTQAPKWMNLLIVAVLGVLTAFIAGRLTPLWGFFAVSALAISYVLINCLFLFDSRNWVMDLAGPQAAMVLVWSACSLMRIRMETVERSRVTRRFRSYVDPTLVNYVIERPDVRLEGETRELTVCFSDLAGFTAHSERLGDKIVGLLSEIMGLMVPIIRGRRGYVNKFLGDGIMFFFGAPIHNPDHATDAVMTALLMQQALEKFNDEMKDRRLPPVKMRIGISTGLMVVGDAGSKDASDYTVLGDVVNLGSRLESANKMTGTSILISARTAQLIGDKFLLRPVGALQVVGKTQFVRTFEVRGLADAADERQRKLCERTGVMIEHFRARAFDQAIQLADELDQSFGPSTLTALYRDLCESYLRDPPVEPFDGKIVFTEK